MTVLRSKPYIVAVDIGTTSTKTLVIDREGQIRGSRSIEYPLLTPKPDVAEQDPLQIFGAVLRGIREALQQCNASASQVLCVSFSSAMHSVIAVDRELNPLTRCITWADNRCAGMLATLKTEHDAHQIYLDTGTPIHPMSPLLKLMWMKKEMPDLFRASHKFVGIKEFVFAKLFGQFIIDHSLASATGLFNLRRLDWDERALAAAGVGRDRLSEPVPTTRWVSGLPKHYAEEMGLMPDTPFVVGASDGVLANLGAGSFEPGHIAVTIGTSGAVRGVVREPKTDPQGRLFCYALKEDFWVIGGPINNGGIMFRWVRDELATLEAEEGRKRGQDPYDYLTELAAGVAPGSDGLIFLPLLAGERAPYWNANARGTFFGLALHHRKAHMIRAVLEGVMYRIHSVVAALEELAGKAVEIRASGGFARSALWRQIMADVLGTEIVVPDAIESSGLGAAALGLLAMGEIKHFDEIRDWIRVGARHVPDSGNHRIYRELTQIYHRVYMRLKDEFDAIASFQHQYVK